MSDPQPSSPIQHQTNHTHNENSQNKPSHSPEKKSSQNNFNSNSNANNSSSNIVRRERPARECTKRAAARLQAAAAAEAEAATKVRKKKTAGRKERLAARLLREEEDEEKSQEGDDEEEVEEGENGSPSSRQQCGKIVTQLVGEPEPSQLPRWNIRSMWQLASILNFLNVFRPLLNIRVEFSAEEFETALITPNDTLGHIHMPLLKAIPPVTRMALGHNTWITVLCRKLRDWWHWVAEGELPIVAAQGAEIEAYSALDPAVRVVILKALCDIRVEQEDIRNYIDENLKQGVHLSLFRKERIGGDSHGISYWYENDPIIGHRLYREIRKIEIKKGKGKTVPQIPSSCYQWETVATNLDEFQDVSEKLFSSKNRTEASVGKKLKNDMLAEVESVHKKKEKLLKKQHRQALMLDNMLNMDGLSGGRSLRDRKPVTYTFDDYDRSINEAIKITKNGQPSAEPALRRDPATRHETSTNGRLGSPPHLSQHVSFRVRSPKSPEYDEYDEDHNDEQLDRSNRRRQRPQRYSASEFIEELSENEADFDSDDDIMGEAVYDEEYLRKRKQRKVSSSSEGDDEYHWDEENPEDEEEEYEDEDSPSASEESDEPRSRRFKKLPGRTRRETKLRSVGNLQSGLRRSNRATRNRINYSNLEMSESESESTKPEKSNGSEEHYDASDNAEFSMGSDETEENNDNEETKVEQPVNDVPSEMATVDQNDVPKRTSSPDQDQDDVESGGKRRFLDLNELAPGPGFNDGPNSVMKDEGADDF